MYKIEKSSKKNFFFQKENIFSSTIFLSIEKFFLSLRLSIQTLRKFFKTLRKIFSLRVSKNTSLFFWVPPKISECFDAQPQWKKIIFLSIEKLYLRKYFFFTLLLPIKKGIYTKKKIFLSIEKFILFIEVEHPYTQKKLGRLRNFFLMSVHKILKNIFLSVPDFFWVFRCSASMKKNYFSIDRKTVLEKIKFLTSLLPIKKGKFS